MSVEELNIRGLTGVDVTLRIAGPGTRAYAFIIDWHVRVLLALAWVAVGLLVLQLGGAAVLRVFQFGFLLPAALLYVFYHPVLEVLMHGRTPGKRMAGCRIVTQEGATPGTGALVSRNVFRLIDTLPSLYVLGLVFCFCTSQRVRIGDLAAGTVLVLDEPKPAHSLDRVGTLANSSRLDPDMAALVRDLLDRWNEMDPGQADAIAQTILSRVDKENVPDPIPGFGRLSLRARLENLLASA